ncbi:DUF934 domain-containing protein [Spartinivicinus poritis]|uniref:DUF934 domain-containing protein n=1 Tax=Spartinivicinus poritis TaxID=2994640 RepID=A0ABT5U7D4_9GAMM|nr:DUF934 domain-containing protein [Spartinivicinus sp. A2-2]MDE1461069.1 DUF934 domain-containing protein [Spartinivicinus sp. A2-2]
MPKLIKNQDIIDDNYQLLETAPAADQPLPEGNLLVPLTDWLENQQRYVNHQGSVGVWLDSHEEPELLAAQIQSLPVIAVNFPQFTDGRGYSIGRLLRERFGFLGELRAIGDVLRDQLFYMARCGFNAFAIRADRCIDDALNGLKDFSETYQAAVDQPQPLFRRRQMQAE